ncbi:hypothetical protein H0H81_010899 [Sphagnurus paluster]|uniref:Uncharacterized protein n=1 Tax=Sphagnurus paluster TaxID=117069 RepID=A0A9P7GHR1_9AGAR|nr:hypothetical protein H0H81_010899 [Sphagnurus paluster]
MSSILNQELPSIVLYSETILPRSLIKTTRFNSATGLILLSYCPGFLLETLFCILWRTPKLIAWKIFRLHIRPRLTQVPPYYGRAAFRSDPWPRQPLAPPTAQYVYINRHDVEEDFSWDMVELVRSGEWRRSLAVKIFGWWLFGTGVAILFDEIKVDMVK